MIKTIMMPTLLTDDRFACPEFDSTDGTKHGHTKMESQSSLCGMKANARWLVDGYKPHAELVGTWCSSCLEDTEAALRSLIAGTNT